MNFFILLLALLSLNVFAGKKPIPGSRYQHLTGVKVPEDSKGRWDKRYSRSTFIYGKSPSKFLAANYHYIPFKAQVLDMGMGEGRNSVFLAQKGYKVTGIDISSVAVKKAYKLAGEFGVKIKGVVASLNDYTIKPNSFDAIICFYYVDRTLVEKIISWLKPGGILIYEAYTENEKKNKKSDYLNGSSYLEEQELLKMFPGMRILKYEEPLHEKEFRSSIILRKN